MLAKQNEVTLGISICMGGTHLDIISRNGKACASKEDIRKSNKIEFDK